VWLLSYHDRLRIRSKKKRPALCGLVSIFCIYRMGKIACDSVNITLTCRASTEECAIGRGYFSSDADRLRHKYNGLIRKCSTTRGVEYRNWLDKKSSSEVKLCVFIDSKRRWRNVQPMIVF
jgi:hypothetical protein